MVSEKNQSQYINTVWFHLYETSKIVKLTETQYRMVIAWAGVERQVVALKQV
jgi:hypothetical protein